MLAGPQPRNRGPIGLKSPYRTLTDRCQRACRPRPLESTLSPATASTSSATADSLPISTPALRLRQDHARRARSDNYHWLALPLPCLLPLR